MKLNISVLNIILVFVISLFFAEKSFSQTGCTNCTSTNPIGGQNTTLTINIGDVVCFTENREFGELIVNGGTICIAEGITLMINNNVNTTVGTTLNLEIYGILQFNQTTTLNATVNANIYSNGILRSGSTGGSDFTFAGSGNNYINNDGLMDMGVLTFSNSSGIYYFDNKGTMSITRNINIQAKTTKFKNNPGSTLTIGASFNMNEGTEFYNCGEITTASGFNMGGGNVVNTNSFTVNGNVNYGNETSRFDNFGTLNINNGDIQMSNNTYFYNEGVAIFSSGSFANDGHILGPEVGSGKLGYIYFNKAVTMNNGSIGPNLNFKNTNGTSSFAVMFNDRPNINIEDGVSWDCESSGTCAAEKQTVLDLCPDFDGNFPDPDPEDPLNTTNAVDDFYETGKNTLVSGNVLDNDFDLEGHTQTVSTTGTFTTAKGGSVTINSDGTFTYTPPTGGFSDFDSFEYTVCDNGTPKACDEAEVVIAVGICYEAVEGKPFKWSDKNLNGAVKIGNTLSKTITQPAANYGFVFDIYELDNSFNMKINDVELAVDEIEFQSSGTPAPGINIKFADGANYETNTGGAIWQMRGTADRPLVRVKISPTGKVSMYGSKTSGGELYPLVLFNGNNFNDVPVYIGSGEDNVITVTQNIVGATVIEGTGYGANQIDCTNYWYGYEGADWDKEAWNEIGNWTDNYVPATKEDIEFATIENNRNSIKGMSGPGAGKGAAKNDLYVPSGDTKEIKDLINETVDAVDGSSQKKSLVIPPNSVLHIYGVATDSNTDPDKIVVKASKEDATGTLYFPIDEDKPDKNKEVQATVEFYNQAYDCKDCGYFTRSWQYFGIPVSESGFPYLSSQMETINEWMENVNGNKWVAVGTNNLKAFRGYEITNSTDEKPTHIYSFKGTLNVGDATVGLTKTTTPAVNYSGMNLIANSFTAAIPIKREAISYTDGALEKDVVYLFNTGTRDQWRKLNGGNVPNVVGGTYTSVPLELGGQADLPNSIPSMHTFMVEAKSNTNIDLIYSELVKNVAGDSQPAWRSAQDKIEIPHIVLDVIGTQSADRVWLFEQSGTTRGFDNGWDGIKMPEKDIMQIYVSGETVGENYQVATVPQLIGTAFGVNTVNTVETGHALSNQSQSQLQLHMAVSPDVEIRGLYLRDMLTGRSYALKNGAEYRVSGSVSSDNRFKVVDNALDESKLSDNPLIDIYVQDNQVVVANNSEEDCIVSLFDISGRLVAKRAVASNGTTYVSTAISGVYVVKVIGGTVNESKRVVVK